MVILYRVCNSYYLGITWVTDWLGPRALRLLLLPLWIVPAVYAAAFQGWCDARETPAVVARLIANAKARAEAAPPVTDEQKDLSYRQLEYVMELLAAPPEHLEGQCLLRLGTRGETTDIPVGTILYWYGGLRLEAQENIPAEGRPRTIMMRRGWSSIIEKNRRDDYSPRVLRLVEADADGTTVTVDLLH